MSDAPMTSRGRLRARARFGALAMVAMAGLCAPVAAGAQQPPPAEAAAQALEQAEQVLAGQEDGQTADATAALDQLAAALPALEGAERRRGRALLMRPTDGARDPFGDGYTQPAKSAFSDNFCVFWVEEGPDAPPLAGVEDDGVPDYVEELLAIAEFSRSVEVAPGPLGWAPPKPDKDGCGADAGARADIYLKNVGEFKIFGYQALDPGQGQARSQHGYMVLDNDFAEWPYFPTPLDAARVTFAHEYNHLLQSNYDSFEDTWMLEATATWAEEHVYPEINDYLVYVAAFARFPGLPITEAADTRPANLKVYGSAAWNHWLATGGGGYGVGVIRNAWEISDTGKRKGFALSAYDRAIRAAGGPGFEREFVEFTAATAEWQTGFGGFPDAALYPTVKRKGTLGRAGKRFKLDHTSARFMNVNATGPRAKLRVRTETGLRAGIALVGIRATGEVVAKTKYLPKGRRASVTLPAPGEFERITAVIVNADPRVRGSSTGGWIYSRDRQRFAAQIG